MSRIAVVGSWHLASVMSCCFADKGHRVTVVDDDEAAIGSLSRGVPTVFEPKMQAITRRNIKSGRLLHTTDFNKALANATMIFLAIDTPITADGVDLTPIWNAAKKIAAATRKDNILVVSSQVPIGTCEELLDLVREINPNVRCELVCNPEFLRLGAAIDLFRNADRIILGAESPQAARQVEATYAPFGRPVVLMTLREAEVVKHATNAYVASSVSFIGEISQLCDEMGADAMKVGKALRLDKRVGKHAYLSPGLGFNGGTVARDVKLLISLTERVNKKAPLLQAVLDVNQRQNSLIVERLKAIFGTLRGINVGLLGLTYKAYTSTLRNSLTLQIARQMQDEGIVLKAYDPIISPESFETDSGIEICGSAHQAADGVDALVLMTPKDQFKELELAGLHSVMRQHVLVDAVNLFDRDEAVTAGFTYVGLGRGFKWVSGNGRSGQRA